MTMNAKLYAVATALLLALVPADRAPADEVVEYQTGEGIRVEGQAQGPDANVEILTDDRGNTTVRAQAGMDRPRTGTVVVRDPAARTFQLQGDETIYVAPQPVQLEPLVGETVTIHTQDGTLVLDAPRTGERYEIEIERDAFGNSEIEIERERILRRGSGAARSPADPFDSDAGVEAERIID